MLHQHKRSKESKSDNWHTPKKEAKELFNEYKFYPILDVAATNKSSKCKWYIDRYVDALKTNWLVKGKKVLCFCNPPNKQMSKFIDRTYQQFRDLGVKTMLIVPLNTQTSKAWWRSVQKPKERGEKILVRPMNHRINFEHNGLPSSSSINGYCVIIFGRSKK